jgi:hypothetical protein
MLMLGLLIVLALRSAISEGIVILIHVTIGGLLLVGLITGIAGVIMPHRKRALAIGGLVLNTLLSLYLLIMLLGHG